MRRAVLLASLVLPGCFEIRPPHIAERDGAAAIDASAPPRILSIDVLDASGRPREPGTIPRTCVIRIRASAPIGGDPDPILLITGDPDAALVDDLTDAPLRAATLSRGVAHERTIEGSTIELRPTAPLAPGAHLTIAIAAWARDGAGRELGAPRVLALVVDEDPSAGARAIEAWPPDGASGIGPALSFAAVRFDGDVSGIEDGVWLEGAGGERVPGAARGARCDEIGWAGERCAVVVPARALAPGALHTIRTGAPLIDGTGASVPAWSATFVTALGPDVTPPSLVAIACALDEQSLEVGCVLADDASVALRLRASEPVRLRADAVGRRFLAVGPRGDAEIAIAGLGPSALLPIRISLIDAAGNETILEAELSTTEPLAPLAITEVRADPHGPEPRQEYVEIENRGTEPIDLAGFALSDHPTSVGDVIAGSAPIAPGARVLVVPADFDPDDRGEGDHDAAIPPGVPLVRVDRALGSGGLSNAGEPVLLRDPMGRRVSAAPAAPMPREGVCIVRAIDDARTGAAGSFDYDPGGSCTPGRHPR